MTSAEFAQRAINLIVLDYVIDKRFGYKFELLRIS